jgi:ankyrin repeat protein
MHRAAAICYDLAIQRLLNAGAPVNCPNESGETALHVAARNNCLISVRKLLEAEADADAESYHQWTPLHVAARYGHVAIMGSPCGC